MKVLAFKFIEEIEDTLTLMKGEATVCNSVADCVRIARSIAQIREVVTPNSLCSMLLLLTAHSL